MRHRHVGYGTLIMLAALSLLGPTAAYALPKVGQPLAEFSVTTPSSQVVTNRNYSDRVVLLVFSTDYCTACKNAIPGIGRLAERYGKQGFYVLGLFSGSGMESEDLRKYMKTSGVTYPMALVDQRVSAEQFGMVSVPYSLLINRKGIVAGIYYGYSDRISKQIEEQVRKLLAE